MAEDFEIDTGDLQRRMDGAIASLKNRVLVLSAHLGEHQPVCWNR